jgi:hypothetical protein
MDVILLAPAGAAAPEQQDEQQMGAAGSAKREVARFPAHSTFFCNSKFLWCRVSLRNLPLQRPTPLLSLVIPSPFSP